MVSAKDKTLDTVNYTDEESRMDDSDADAFAVLSLLVIAAAAFVYFLNH